MCDACGCRGRFRRRGPRAWQSPAGERPAAPRQTPIERFLEPCLLLLLHGAPAHGYTLKAALEGLDLSDGPADVGNLYRTLRRMEEDGWVSSQWVTDAPGPRRRVYELTPLGEQFLRSWMAGLRTNRERIDRLLALYDERFEEGGESDA